LFSEALRDILEYVTSNVNSLGEQALQAVAQEWDEVREVLGGEVHLRFINNQRPMFEEYRSFGPSEEGEVIAWLRQRLNEFVNVFRPRVKAVIQDLTDSV